MTEPQFDHIGGHPLIDLVNTEIMQGGQRIDLLASNDDVIAWLVDVGLITETTLHFNWRDDPALLANVRTFRQQMRQMLVAIVSRQPMEANTIAAINGWLAHWQGQPNLKRLEDGFERTLVFEFSRTEQLLAHIADEAASFLATVPLQHVKRCGNGECIRFFLDTSKNHSRRWCSMEGCGNRMKARAHYARKQ